MTLRSIRLVSAGCALGAVAVLSMGASSGQAATPSPQGTATSTPAAADKPRALLDQYCVTCHNDRLKTANLSLQGADLTKVSEHAELWEKVIRKLRAGVMPPPDLPRPSLADYDGLRDWLEAEIDRATATKVHPGSVVLHRLNRTEYANAIRDLLDLRIDVTTLLPPDDSANGFDNIAGSLTISPTLLESYATAAARVARMAVGYWKSPAEATYLASSDASQNHRLEGMPFGTRGGIVARHDFPADGEYKFSIQNFGIGSFVPNEQLALIIDGERAHTWRYRGVGMAVGMTADGDGTLEVTVPVRAGSRVVGATFLATNYRPSLDIIRQYDRKSLENNTIPQLEYYPAIGFIRIQGPFNAQRPVDSAQPAEGIHLQACAAVAGERVRDPDPDDACAPRVSSSSNSDGDRDTSLLLRRGTQGRRPSTTASSTRCGSAACEPAVPGARRAGARSAARAGQAVPRSPISSLRRGSRSSCGAASRTTS